MARSDRIDPVQRSLINRANIASRWAGTADRAAATAPARSGFRARFERQVDPDGTLPADERARRTDAAIRAHMLKLSAKARAGRVAKRRQREERLAAELRAAVEKAEQAFNAAADHDALGGDAA
jgi:hypothetical protein